MKSKSLPLFRVDSNQYKSGDTITPKGVYQATMVSALFHDIGYPWQYINKVGTGIGIVDNNLEGAERQIAENIYAQIAERLLI